MTIGKGGLLRDDSPLGTPILGMFSSFKVQRELKKAYDAASFPSWEISLLTEKKTQGQSLNSEY